MGSKRVVLFGGGLVGAFIARRVHEREGFSLTLCDRDPELVARQREAGLDARVVDAEDDAALRALAREAELFVGALPGALGYRLLERLVTFGRPVVDIGFFPEDPAPLDARAKESGALLVVDCGLMPGFGGMLAMHLAGLLDEARRARILVGGLPLERRWPLAYKAPFSPADVIEEYTRPARVRRGGRIVVRPALSEPEPVDFPGIGTLEAFLSDGLRTLLATLPLEELEEKTLRYPGHAELMRALSALGFFDDAPREIEGGALSPRALTSALLFDAWKLEPDEPEITAMRVEAEGVLDAAPARFVAELFDARDDEGWSSMARTTGLPALAALELVAEGALALGPGVHPAETLARDAVLFERIVATLRDEGVRLSIRREEL